jgi:hypothetical protein
MFRSSACESISLILEAEMLCKVRSIGRRFFVLVLAGLAGAVLLPELASAQPLTKRFAWGHNGKCYWTYHPNTPVCSAPRPGFHGPVSARFCRNQPMCYNNPAGMIPTPGVGRGQQRRDIPRQEQRR